MKSMRAAIAGSAPMVDDGPGLGQRLWRLMLGTFLLPLCWITSWTFLSQFSRMTHQGFWKTPEFWYFAVGAILMGGWFISGLLQSFFLYLYVLGHELTHALFVYLCRGKVMDFHVSTSGGYITTNKTNLIIALSPYFVPLWSLVAVLVFSALRWFVDLSQAWNLAFYGLMGLTWTFHIVWTLWMIPRDQPDLKEHGTYFSLAVIFFGNLLVLVGMLCLGSENPGESFARFGKEWVSHAATSVDVGWRWLDGVMGEMKLFWHL